MGFEDFKRRLKAFTMWIDPEDKDRFERIQLELSAERGKKQTQEEVFKFILDEFFENHRGVGKK